MAGGTEQRVVAIVTRAALRGGFFLPAPHPLCAIWIATARCAETIASLSTEQGDERERDLCDGILSWRRLADKWKVIQSDFCRRPQRCFFAPFEFRRVHCHRRTAGCSTRQKCPAKRPQRFQAGVRFFSAPPRRAASRPHHPAPAESKSGFCSGHYPPAMASQNATPPTR